MWSAGVLSRVPVDEIDLDETAWAPEPCMVPLPGFLHDTTHADAASDFCITSLTYSPSNFSMAGYGDSSATPSSPGTDGDPEACLVFHAEVCEYRFLGPPQSKADELANVAMGEGVISFGQNTDTVTELLSVLAREPSFMDPTQGSVNMSRSFHGALLCSLLFSVPIFQAGLSAHVFFIQMSMTTRVHRGQHNDDATENLVLACSRWEGGHLWLGDADGDVVLEDGLKGRTISVQPSGAFNGHVLHRAMPWTGCRTVLVGFHVRDMWRLGDDEVAQLQRLGFMLRSFMES